MKPINISLDTDWFGKTVKNPVRYVINPLSNALEFSCSFQSPEDFDSSIPSGQFQAELWKRDVAELFIRNRSTEEYYEFNLSPGGAYWAAKFTGYRQVDQSWDGANLITPCPGKIGIVIPTAAIGFNPVKDNLQFFGVISIAGERIFLSEHPHPDSKPDFHEKKYWKRKGI